MYKRQVYAVYSFARKVGQALAGGIGGWALQVIGYEPAAAAQTDAVRRGLYTTATVSYTHLDVYKRQDHGRAVCTARTAPYCDRCCLNDICKKAGI